MIARGLLLAALVWAPSALAHGGEDHGAPPPPPAATSKARSAAATTASVEVVAKWPAQAPGIPLVVRLLVTDFASNAPIEAARIEAEVSGPTKATATAQPTASPGIYQLTFTPAAPGAHTLSLTLTAGELVDVVALADVEVGEAKAAPPAAPEAPARWPALLFGMFLGFLAGALSLSLAGRRRIKSAAASAVLLLAFAEQANAHGGEDHGGDDHGDEARAPEATPSASGAVFLAKESQLLLGVRTALAEERPITARLVVPGTVTVPPEKRVAVVVPQSGRLAASAQGFPRLGQAVKRGALLAVLEPALSASERATFSAEAARAQGAQRAAEARLLAAKGKLERLERSAAVVAPTEIEAARVEVHAAEADIDAARGAQAAFAKPEVSSRLSLTAPIDGVIADVAGAPGEVLEAGRAAFLIVDAGELWVEARVHEDLAPRLEAGAALVIASAWPGRSFAATPLATAAVVDERTRTIKVVLRLTDADSPLRVGQRVSVQLGGDAGSQALVVPAAAVLDVDGKHVLYVHTEPEVFVAREVALGRRDGANVEIVRGVAPGERVVVVGSTMLRNAPPAPGR